MTQFVLVGGGMFDEIIVDKRITPLEISYFGVILKTEVSIHLLIENLYR